MITMYSFSCLNPPLPAQFLSGASEVQRLRVLRKAVEANAPNAIKIVGGACAAADDKEVESLLTVHHKACRNSMGLRLEVQTALTKGSPMMPPTDFPRKCLDVCAGRLQDLFESTVRAAYDARDELTTVHVSDRHQTFTGLCAPVLEALLDGCGPRRGLDLASVAKGHAAAGNEGMLLKALQLGYSIVDESSPGGDAEKSHAPHELVLQSRYAAAAKVLSHYPHLGPIKDPFGVAFADLLAAHTQPAIPPVLASPPAKAHAGQSGGWPALPTVVFPGWREGSCDVAEVSGAAVLADPAAFVRAFILKHVPVIIRDFVRHDAAGLAPLLKRMSKRGVLAAWGGSSWEAGTIPYEDQYVGTSSPEITLREYVDSVMANAGDSARAAEGVAPRYIFDTDPKNTGSRGINGIDEVFPEVPSVLASGLDGVARFRKGSGQFFLGGAGSGAPQHYHTNPAWNALVYGRKGWVLSPPHDTVFSNVPAATKVKDLGSEVGSMLRCVQEAGDVIVVPKWWGHMTLNLAPSIGTAKEFHVDPVLKHSQPKQAQQAQKAQQALKDQAQKRALEQQQAQQAQQAQQRRQRQGFPRSGARRQRTRIVEEEDVEGFTMDEI